MNKFINRFGRTVVTATQLVNHHPQIIIASLIVGFLSIIGRMISLPAIGLVMSLLIFGWGFVEIELLHKATKKEKIDWKKLPNQIVKYLKKTWLLIVTGLLIIFVILPIALTFYFVPKFAGEDARLTAQLSIAREVENIQTMISGSIGLPAFIVIVDAITTLISLWFIQAMIILVVKEQSIFRSLKLAGGVLIKKIWFFLALTLVLSVIGIATRNILEISSLVVVTRILYLAFSTYLTLLIKATILTNFLE